MDVGRVAKNSRHSVLVLNKADGDRVTLRLTVSALVLQTCAAYRLVSATFSTFGGFLFKDSLSLSLSFFLKRGEREGEK